jgi:hypothetical protein
VSDEKKTYVPVSPGGYVLMHLEAKTEEQAIKNLLRYAAHMPYKTWDNFQRRGYYIGVAEKP